MAKEKMKLGADLSPEVVEGFRNWVEQEGLGKAAAGNAALVLIQYLPLDLRRLALRGEWENVREWFGNADAALLAEKARAVLLPPKPSKGRSGYGRRASSKHKAGEAPAA